MDEGSGVAVSCGVGRRRGLDPAWLLLWCRLVAVAPIRPLACEPPYAKGAALKRQKDQTNKKKIVRCPAQMAHKGGGTIIVVIMTANILFYS